MTERQHKGPLAGMRVLDLSHVMAGPVCGLMLADMGADVIKIERIPIGDDSRQMTTPSIGGESAAFMMMNRNKRGLALDLKKLKGQEVFRRLVKGADALIENYRKGTMEKFGLGYEALKAVNPGLIYCEISGFGRTGPMASQGGFDLVTQGMSGLMAITGEGPGRPPVKVGAPITDITGGLLATIGVCAAYAHKLKTGEGQRVDTSLFEAGITQTYWQSAIAFATGVSPGPLGSAHPLSAPYQAFADQGRVDHARRLQPEDLGAVHEDARRRPTSPPTRALPTTRAAWPICRRWSAHSARTSRSARRRRGSRCCKRRACRQARCCRLPRCTPIPRRLPATWCPRSSTPRPAGCAPSACR